MPSITPRPIAPKIGARVKFRRRNGTEATGRIAELDQRANGLWVIVYTGDKRSLPPKEKFPEDFTAVRPSQLIYV